MVFKEKLEAEGAWKRLVNAYREGADTYEKKENPGLVDKALSDQRRNAVLGEIQAALIQFKETEVIKKSNGSLEETVSNLARSYHVIIKDDATQKIYDGFYQKELSKLVDPIVDLTFRAARESFDSYLNEIQQRKQHATTVQSHITDHLTLFSQIKPTELCEQLQAKYTKLSQSLKPEKMPSKQELMEWVNKLKEPTKPYLDYQRELDKAPVGIQLLFHVSREDYASTQQAFISAKTTPTLRRGG